MNKNKQTKIIQGGFSDIRLWPCYMLGCSVMLFLFAHIGIMTTMLVVVSGPALLFAKFVWSAFAEVRQEQAEEPTALQEQSFEHHPKAFTELVKLFG